MLFDILADDHRAVAPVVCESETDIFKELFTECLRSLEDRYLEGTRRFIQASHPALDKAIGDAWDRIEASWGKDLSRFRQAHEEYRRLQIQAIALFKGRAK